MSIKSTENCCYGCQYCGWFAAGFYPSSYHNIHYMSKVSEVKERLYGYQRKPLLIYDGDCGFCKYWVDYWHKLTGDKVKYKPYQEVKSHYPEISEVSFKRAVQYVAPSGDISSAAKASFLTLSHARGMIFLLWLYRFLPGFAFLSEKIYQWIASHREFSYRICLFLWGRHYEPPRYEVVAWLFLRAIGLIYLAAFLSFAMQALGLIGDQGIAPLKDFIALLNQHIGVERYWLAPMVFWLSASHWMIQLVSWGGVLLSVLLVLNIFPRITLLLLYVLYLSLVYAAQVFMTFQWDLFLLEAGFISIFLVGTTTLGVWLLRWLLFRFMWAGGLVKVLSGDPTWRDFTALQYYFNTEPLPTPLAWYANQLPVVLLKAGAMATLFVELFVVFLIFFPRHIRFFAAFTILLLQVVILITGNYNFFNILTIALCLVCVDDAALRKILPLRKANRQVGKIFTTIALLFTLVTVPVSIAQFDLRFRGSHSSLEASLVRSIASLRLVNVYGPFAVMTTKRYEIIIEGSEDGETWQTYQFKYKPGNLYRRPPWNIPFQPRLDWQMWFAALGSVYENPWFEVLMQRLLDGSPDVLALLATNPFPDNPPHYVRAQLYDYRFTTYEERRKSGAWWARRYMGSYFP